MNVTFGVYWGVVLMGAIGEVGSVSSAVRPEIYVRISAEVLRSAKHQLKFASLHEAYAVILEELDELWEIARMKRKNRSRLEIERELVQIAAMAVKALQSMDNFTGGCV